MPHMQTSDITDWTPDELTDLSGKLFLITGGNSGIGFEAAKLLAERNADVVIAARNEMKGKKALAKLVNLGDGNCELLRLDLADMSSIRDAAKEAGDRFGAVYGLINNAGVAWGATLEEFPESGWDKVMDVNVKGIFFLFQKLIPLLRKSASAEDPARVINIASIDGMHTSPFSGYAYGTSKAAVIHLTRFMASQHVAEHILVNGIAPGPFPTYMLSTGVGFGGKTEGVDWDSVAARNPSGRVGEPSDIAGLAMFLSSKASSFITGHTIPCDGGIVSSS